MNQQTAVTRETERDRIRRLPAIRELEETYGPPPFDYLDGRTLPMSAGETRMAWLWPAGRLCVDQRHLDWRVLAIGPAGHVDLTVAGGRPPGDGTLRAAAIAAGLRLNARGADGQVVHDPATDWCACQPGGPVVCDYRLLADTVIKKLNPADGDEAEVGLCIQAVEFIADYVEWLACTCTWADDSEPCRRCAALGQRHAEPVHR